jgi:hypothetical protein
MSKPYPLEWKVNQQNSANFYDPNTRIYHPGTFRFASGEYGDYENQWTCCKKNIANPGCAIKDLVQDLGKDVTLVVPVEYYDRVFSSSIVD